MMKTMRFVMATLVVCFGLTINAYADSFYVKPHLQNVAPDGVTIIWQTHEKGPAEVEYGVEGSFDGKATVSADEEIRRVRITGLKPDTSYSYRVRAGEEEYVNSFKTSPGANNDREVTFIIFGDTRRWDERVQETDFINEILRWNPEFFVINGDLVGNGHQYELWPQHFKRFSALNGKFMIATARGNHEGSMLNDTDNDWFGKYHEMPGGSEPYAAFDWGNVHVVLLSWEQTMLNHVKDTAQWLDQHLSGVSSRYTFVTQHFPVYCTGYAGPTDNRKEPGESMAYIRRILDKHHVTAHMAGHTHIYERHYPLRENKRDDRNGVHYLVNGGDIGGNYPDWWTAVSDDKATMAKPTYTVYQCK
ncbi:MAG: metallophosphoesterase, partial [Candidatus Hydrogenedentes bacterium]|nr:metallophosphoesterase [Candidatus Hydrogenedentota bacterium]